jgi:hypothetical protein
MKNGKWKIATPTFCCSLTERHPFTPSPPHLLSPGIGSPEKGLIIKIASLVSIRQNLQE